MVEIRIHRSGRRGRPTPVNACSIVPYMDERHQKVFSLFGLTISPIRGVMTRMSFSGAAFTSLSIGSYQEWSPKLKVAQ